MKWLALLAVALFTLTTLGDARGDSLLDALAPAEYGTAVELYPAAGEDGFLTLSWQATSFEDTALFATVLSPYDTPGLGLDAGPEDASQRFGVGWFHDELMVYGRLGF